MNQLKIDCRVKGLEWVYEINNVFIIYPFIPLYTDLYIPITLSIPQFLAKLKIMDYSLLIGLHTLPDADKLILKDTSESGSNGEFLFYRDFKGFQASFEDNSDGPEVYYLGKMSGVDL